MTPNVEQIIREYIDKTVHMSLATVSGDKPWVCEVHFVYDDGLNLYWRSLASRRHSQELAVNPQVAGNIVRQHELNEEPQAIYFEGIAEMLTDAAQRQAIFPVFRARLGADESILDEAASSDGHQFYKLTVENWYAFGKFGGDTLQKYQLAWKSGRKG